MNVSLLLNVVAGIFLLLFLILRLKLPAFIALLISSIVVGLLCGMGTQPILDSVQRGMGSTLSFVAVVVGLGAMFGAILEHSGGALSLAGYLTSVFGEKRTPSALAVTGFLVAIPVFFDVAFIILVPVLYALQEKTGRSLLFYAVPLLAALATTHAFIPPTPGPIAVADILAADLGWVILLGFLAGIPTVLVSGLWFGRIIARKIHVPVPDGMARFRDQGSPADLPPVGGIAFSIFLPIGLIVVASMCRSGLIPMPQGPFLQTVLLLGHPFVALILANLWVWYLLGLRRGVDKAELLQITTKSLAPAGVIILLTGAGGVFKQILMDTGAGEMLAQSMSDAGLPLIVFAFLTAALVRVAQGSATVAMITAAGLAAPVATVSSLSEGQLAALVIAIASGASILSHVNDSGFWLVKQYLGMDERQTFRSWTLMTTLLAVTGFAGAAALYALL